MEDTLKCFGIYSKRKGIPIEKRRMYSVVELSCTDKRIKKYIASAIDYAERYYMDVYIYENDKRIRICLYPDDGEFYGRNKKDFTYLFENADDCIILPDKDKGNASLEVSLCLYFN